VKVTDDVKNVRRVHVELSAGEVRRLIYDKVADTLGADVDTVVEHLRVDLSDGASATTYVRGELPVSRDQLLESLGLTPTEPVETDGAAVAESLGDHVTGTSDVVETPETLAAFGAVAGDPDQVARGPEYVLRVYHDLLSSLRDRPKAVGALRAELDDMAEVNPNSVRVSLLRPIVEALERPWSPGPAVGDNPGVQLGAGEYAPQSEELPEVQVLSVEDATTQVERLIRTLRRMPEVVRSASQQVEVLRRLSPHDEDVAVSGRILEGLAVEGHPAWTAGSEDLPEVQIDRPESPATLTVNQVVDDLARLTVLIIDVQTEHPAATSGLLKVMTHVSSMLSTLGKYHDCILVEGGGSQRVVPRPVSEDNLRQARLKLMELANGPRHELGRATATELHYVLTLLGGEL